MEKSLLEDYEKALCAVDEIDTELRKAKKELIKKEEIFFHYLTDFKYPIGTIFSLGTEFTYKIFKVGIKHYHPSNERYNPFVLAKRVNRKTFIEIISTSDQYSKEIYVSRIKEIFR